ncbi:MAG: NAD(P)H-quinone oxidoreductase [Myxococcota bacterium]
MNAIEDRDGLVWVPVPTPVPGPGEVRIRIAATAVNRADLVQRSGAYPPPPGASAILGLECAGRIDAVGEGVRDRSVGDEVVALLAGGGYAEQVCCPASHTLPLPAGFTMERAAAVVEVFATAWLNLRLEGALAEGEHVLVHAGASGVGTAAIQLCVAWGNPVFATVGSEAKAERCRALGAAGTAVRHAGPWGPAVREWGGADVILDPVGGSYLESNVHALRPRGRLVNIGLMGGREGTLPLGPLLVKRLSVKGSVLRSRSIAEKNVVMAGLEREVWPLLADGSVAPVIDRVVDIREAEAAHQAVQRNDTVGKVVLAVP